MWLHVERMYVHFWVQHSCYDQIDCKLKSFVIAERSHVERFQLNQKERARPIQL